MTSPVSRIWKARETFVPEWPGGKRCPYCGKSTKKRAGCCWCIDGRNPNAFKQEHHEDGMHVHGRFPPGFFSWVLRNRILGEDVRREDVLHVCSGSLREKWTVDIRPEVKPKIAAHGCALPFRDATFKAVLLDPPYSDDYARNLYATKNPRPAHLLREAIRVVRPQGRVAILHVACPFTPTGGAWVTVYGITTGPGFRIRALTVYEKLQDGLPL